MPWRVVTLSKGMGLIFVKIVLGGSPVYALMSLDFPIKVFEWENKIFKRFQWWGSVHKNGRCREVAWHRVYTPEPHPQEQHQPPKWGAATSCGGWNHGAVICERWRRRAQVAETYKLWIEAITSLPCKHCRAWQCLQCHPGLLRDFIAQPLQHTGRHWSRASTHHAKC